MTLPLVLLPGHMATRRSWSHQIAALEPSREVIIPAGHERLDSIAAMAGMVAERLPERFDIAAWSMGGYILFALWPEIATRVNKLVLVDTSARPESAMNRQRRAETLARAAREGVRAAHRASLDVAIADPQSVPASFMARLHEAAEGLGIAALEAQIAAMIARADSRPLLPSIGVPTLVVVGEHDRVTPPECAEEMAAAIPAAWLHVFAGAGHCPPFETPETFNAVFAAFLDTDPAPAPRTGAIRHFSLAPTT